MNALTQAQDAYRSSAQPINTPRGIEYRAFVQVTQRLKAAAQRGTAARRDLIAALVDNRKLWTALASDVAGDGNGLPKELRARLLYLSEFTRLHSSKVMRNQASADALVEINTSIMRGLRDGGSAA